MPEDSVFDAVERLHAELDEVRALLTGPETQRAARADARDGRARRGAPVLHDARRSSATASTASSPTGSSPPRAPTTGGPAGCWPRTRCWPRSSESFAGLPLWRSVYRAARAGRASTALRDLAARGVRRRRPARRTGRATGRSGSPRTRAGAVLRAAAAARRPRRRRPRPQRRRARRDRRVVSSSPHAALRAGAAPGGRCAGARTVSCRSGSRSERRDASEPRRPRERRDADEVGSLAEEAAKLLGALSGWAREHGAERRATACPGLADAGRGRRPRRQRAPRHRRRRVHGTARSAAPSTPSASSARGARAPRRGGGVAGAGRRRRSWRRAAPRRGATAAASSTSTSTTTWPEDVAR